MRRNLLFHLYPVKGSFWDWHLEQLRRFRKAFNGRKIVVVAEDRRSAPFAEVEKRLKGLDAEIVRVPNDPARGETRHFLEGLGRLESLDKDELTFYAHGKGVTHRGLKSLIMQSWSRSMYFMNLSSPATIERLLRNRSAAGCFRQELRHGGSRWHYSGTFFWFKHSALYARDWKRISSTKYGVEGYLGKHIPVEESVSLTPRRHFVDLYRHVITPRESRRWLAVLRAPAGAA